MDKKTIGGLIAALRRANGMTQRELAERLNVSDKTISRWERDEGVPDISLIPVIAEIFHITCDELLSGERRSPTAPLPSTDTPSTRGDKQKKRLLDVSLSRYRTLSLISGGISLCGLLAALAVNFGFLRAYIAFYLGTVFLVAGSVCQGLAINRAFLSVADGEANDEDIGQFKYRVVCDAQRIFGLIAVLLGITLPFVLFTGDAHAGLSGKSFLLYGLIFGILLLVLYAFILFFVHHSLLTHGIFTMTQKQSVRYHRNRTLKIKCVGIAIPLLIITFIAHLMSTEIWGPRSIMDGTTFYDYESFVAYMEQDIPYDIFQSHAGTVAAEPIESVYFDENGNAVTEESALRRTLQNRDGEIMCEYVARNRSVCRIRYTEQDGDLLPITVSTYDDLRIAEHKVTFRHCVFGLIYALELITAFVIYLTKRAKR